MKRKNLFVLVSFLIFFVLLPVSCKDENNVGSKVVNALTLHDCKPPVIVNLETLDEYTCQICFDEVVFPVELSFADCNVYSSGSVLNISFTQPLLPGQSGFIEGTVKDKYGNTNTFNTLFWGVNSSPAKLIINELTTKGSKTQPDRTELKVLRAGNLAGITVYDGIPSSYRTSAVLPDEDVKAGDFVVIWWCEELPSGLDQREANAVNVAVGGGLSENNGIICVASSPMAGAPVSNCVVWSNGESSQYDGYGTKEVYQRVMTALENGWWNGEKIDSSLSTSTRAMALDSEGRWYITVQSGITFGAENTSPAYAP